MEQNYLIDNLQPELIHASTGKRFLNFVIDTIGYYAFIILIALPFLAFAPHLFEANSYGEEPFGELGWNVAFFVTYILYYILFEFATGGRTPGKLITGTKAVKTDGSRLDFFTSFKRNAIRLIPFEFFSYFGSPCAPWHDRWVDTMVMDIKQTNLNAY